MKQEMIKCTECNKKFDLTICDLEHDNTPVCPHCAESDWIDKTYQHGYDYACGYFD